MTTKATKSFACASVAGLVLAAMISLLSLLEFDGDLVKLLRSGSPAFQNFIALEEQFQPFSKDEVLLIETDDLAQKDRYDAFRDIVVELQLVPGVEAALSVFSIPDPDTGRGLLRSSAESDPSEQFARLFRFFDGVNMLISPQREMSLLIILPESTDGLTQTARTEIFQIVEDLGSGEFRATFVGLPEAYRQLETALIADQLRLAPFSVIMALLVAALLFRSFRVALLCAAPPLIGLIWFMGVLGALGMSLTTMTSLVPLLVLALGLTNMFHFYLALVDARVLDELRPVRVAWKAIAVPCFLSALTTAFAFGSFTFSGFGAMHDVAVAGVVGLCIQTATVLTLAPGVAILLNLHHRALPPPPRWLAAPLGLARQASRLGYRIIMVSLLLLSVSVWGHFAVVAGSSMDEHLLQRGAVADAEARMKDKLAGTGQRFLILDDPDGTVGLSSDDLTKLSTTVALFEDQGAVLRDTLLERALEELDEDGEVPRVLRRFVAQDGLSFVIPLNAELVDNPAESGLHALELESRLEQFDTAVNARLSGLSHLAALEHPRMIEALRRGILLTVFLVTIVIMVYTRSVWLGLATMVVNAVPVLGIEALFWLTNTPLTMTGATALTIAFGIAVDDSLHMLNRYRIEIARNPEQAIARTLHVVGVPIAASTLLLIACLATTQVSLLPSVATFGMIVCIAMVLAYICDIFLLPAFLQARLKRHL